MSAECYLTIDEMPLYNWRKCNDGDLNYVVKSGHASESIKKESWEKVYDTYLLEFGLNKTYEKYMKLLKKKANLELDYILTGDRFKLTQIEIEAKKIAKLLQEPTDGIGIDEVLIYLSKWLGYKLNDRTITAKEYFVMVKEYGKENNKK